MPNTWNDEQQVEIYSDENGVVVTIDGVVIKRIKTMSLTVCEETFMPKLSLEILVPAVKAKIKGASVKIKKHGEK